MSKPIKIVWPAEFNAINNAAICAAQTVVQLNPPVAQIPLNMNGPLVVNGSVSFSNGVFRQVLLTFTGTANLTNIQFTVTGYTDGSLLSVTVRGTNGAGTVIVGNFNSITSITASAAFPVTVPATQVSVGLNGIGTTQWILHDYNRTLSNTTVFSLVDADTIHYTFQSTMDNPFLTSGTPATFAVIDGVTIPTIPANTPMLNQAATAIAQYNLPVHSSRLLINSSDATGTLTFYLLQQGIT